MVNTAESIEFELEMIRCTLMLNPENQKLSHEEFNELARKELKESRED